jgi:hypothetical protein
MTTSMRVDHLNLGIKLFDNTTDTYPISNFYSKFRKIFIRELDVEVEREKLNLKNVF